MPAPCSPTRPGMPPAGAAPSAADTTAVWRDGFSPGWADRGRRTGYPVRSGISTALFSRTDWDSHTARSQASPGSGPGSIVAGASARGRPTAPDGWKFTERVAEFRYLDTTPLADSAPTQRGTHAQ